MPFMTTISISSEGRKWALRERAANYIAAALAFSVLCYVAILLGSGAEPADRVLLLRYWMLLGAAACAVGVPHVLLPDSRVHLMQLLNGEPSALQNAQLKTWAAVPAGFAAAGALIAFFDPGHAGRALTLKFTHFAEMLLVVAGAGLFSLSYYATLGATSQAWQEGTAGGWYRGATEKSSQVSLGVPDGLVPAITATGYIFFLAILVVGFGGILGDAAGPAAALAPGALFCVWSIARMRGQRGAYDRHFYHTSAFYREVFRTGQPGVRGAQEPIECDAVYWAPKSLRPHVWSGLLQMDRRLPLGRIIGLGHFLLWLMFFQQVSDAVINGYLILFIMLQNTACYLLTLPDLAPRAFQLSLQSPLRWALTRFLVNMRWALPFFLSLGVVALFSERMTFADAALWTAIYTAVAFIAAAIVTWTAEGRHRSRFR